MGEQIPDNAGQQGDESLVAPGDVTPDVEPDAPADGGDGDGEPTDGAWTKEGQQIFTKVTQKISDLGKSIDGKLDALAAQNQQAAAPTKPDDDAEPEAVVGKLDEMFKKTPTYKKMMADQVKMVMAMPEKFVDGVRGKDLEAVTPRLREIIQASSITDPSTITHIAKALAYEGTSKLLDEHAATEAKAAEVKRKKLAQQRPPASSAGAEGSQELGDDAVEELLEKMDQASQAGDHNPDIHI